MSSLRVESSDVDPHRFSGDSSFDAARFDPALIEAAGRQPTSINDRNFIKTVEPKELFDETVSHLASIYDVSRLSQTCKPVHAALHPLLTSEKLVQNAHEIKDPAGIEQRLSEIAAIPQASLRTKPLWALTHRLNAVSEEQFVDANQKVKSAIEGLPSAVITSRLEKCVKLIDDSNQKSDKEWCFNYTCALEGPALNEVRLSGNVADIVKKHDIRLTGQEGGWDALQDFSLSEGPQGQAIIDEIKSGKSHEQAISDGIKRFGLYRSNQSAVSDVIRRRMEKNAV